MSYVDLATIHDPVTGTVAPAAWGDQIREDLEFLIDPPACSVYSSAAQSIASATFVSLDANSESFDNDAMHSTVTNTSRVTIQTAGRYLFIANINFASSASTRVIGSFFVNGTTRHDRVVVPVVGGGTDDRHTISISLVLAAGDYVEVQANHNAGANLNVTLLEFFALFLTR